VLLSPPMKTSALALILSGVALALAACHSDPPHPVADLVVTNGKLRTMDPATPTASALAVTGDRIVFVGSDADAAQWTGPSTRTLDAGGNTVLPGLIDSHIHAAEGALSLGGCTLNDDLLTIDEAAPRIRACFANDKESTWLVVNAVNPAGFKATRQQLDAIIADRPLFLWGSDGHTAWVNTIALERAKITRKTPDPADGRVDRDKAGNATGFLVDGATGLALDAMDKPTPEKRLDALRTVLPQLHATGITSYLEANTDAETVAAYAALAKAQQLTARVTIALETSAEDTPAEFDRLEKLRASLANEPLIRADFIKLFADGVLEYPTQTGALLAPYNKADGTPGTSKGKLYIEPATMNAFVRDADARGFNVHVHAIGDAAVRETLDAFAAARKGGSKRLYSIAHLQLIDPADLPRFAENDVLASFQLQWAQPDNYSIDALTPWLGAERMGREYPARSLAKAGGVIAGGSDWDVSTFNPFEAMGTGMSRMHPEHPERGPLVAAEALTLDEMLAAYTVNAARLIGREGDIGQLAPGKLADFVILDRVLDAKTSAADVRKTVPTRTIFAGREVWPLAAD
jgi:predicted amidohydrolase YtcJ